ncbi:hypothetical protein CLU79DRAFT_242369 [Phycomyces nitens]|nr:hypothetical protein CLU79DRAFT_242369 [Phycomyces nitens]
MFSSAPHIVLFQHNCYFYLILFPLGMIETSMPLGPRCLLNCSSCHKPGHRSFDYPEQESRTCWRPNAPGYLCARCPKNTHRLKCTQSDISDTFGNGESQGLIQEGLPLHRSHISIY